MGHIHSPHKVADQLLFSIDLNQTLDSIQDDVLAIESERVLSFLSLSSTHSKNKPGHVLFPGCYVVGSMNSSTINEEVIRKVKELTGDCPREAHSFSQVYHQGTIIHSSKYGRCDSKRNSTICSFLRNGREQYGSIEQYYIINSLPIAVIKPFFPSGSLLHTAGVS